MRAITVGPAERPGTCIVLEPSAADPGITDDGRRTITEAGATVKEPAHYVGGGRLVATVTDADGNVLGLLQDR